MSRKEQASVVQIPEKWVWDYIGKQQPAFIFGLILAGITAGMTIINPLLSERLIDDVVSPGDPGPLPRLLITMGMVQLIRLGLRYVMVITMEWTSTQAMTSIRARMYNVVQSQDFRFFQKLKAGNMMNRMTADLDMIRHSVAWISFQFVDAVVLFVSALGFLMFINWELALALAAVTPFILYISRRFVGRIRPRFVLLRQKLTSLSTAVTENINGNRVVKAFAREPYEKEHFEKLNADYRDTSVENALIAARYNPLLEGFSQILIVLTLLLGGLFMIRGEMSAGEYMAFSSLTWALSNPLRMLGMLLADLQRFHAAANMIIEIVDSKPGIVDKKDARELAARPAGGIEFRQVNLEIDGLLVLKDINFKVEPGETIGILGSTGSGKTSLVNLLLRFYEPSSGELLLDGVNVQEYSLSSLRRQIGLAMQEVFLFSESVEGNIAYGKSALDSSMVQKAAVQSDADSFIRGMENGYATLVGERGVGLSGGQRQRIALARALAINPAVLILDDTTSAVDSETEAYIQEQLRDLENPCTKIIIAQRITSFRGASQILVMDQGRIIERGTHQELLANRGFYHHIWSLQTGAGHGA
ncbi:MAG: ABC transporter ATP-binding protein/permease [Treponema sp.]|nr:ABC transporter ATP-binding protein/permease [Treponema sp.]